MHWITKSPVETILDGVQCGLIIYVVRIRQRHPAI